MKKLISLFSFFTIITSSSLSIITCAKPIKQKTIDKVVKTLKDKIINLIVNDGNENSVKNAIKINSEVIAKLVNLKIKIDSFTFIKNGSKFHGTFQNNEEYEVILKIKEEDNKYAKKIKDPVRFKIKIIIIDDQQKVDSAVAILNKIQNKPVELATADLNDLTKIQNAVKDLKEYKNAIKHVYLKSNFDLEKTGTVKNGEVITVKGIVNLNDKEAPFKFTVIVKEKADLNQKEASNTNNNNNNNNNGSNVTNEINVNDKNSNGENTFQSKTTEQNLISNVQSTDKCVGVDNSPQTKNNNVIPTYQSTSEKTNNDFKTKLDVVDNLVKMNLTATNSTEEVIEEIAKLNIFDMVIENENDELVDNSSQTKNKGIISTYQSTSERAINKAKNKLNAIDNLHIKMDLTVANLEKIVQEIKKTNIFNSIIDNKIIALADNLTLIKDLKNNINFDDNDRFNHGTTVYVSGTIQYVEKSTMQKTFQFPIKLKDSCENQIKKAKTSLNNIKPFHEVIMNLDDITDKKICKQIKTQINTFKGIVNGEIELDGDLKLTRKNESKNDIKNEEIVYVLGTIKHLKNEKAKENFEFSIKLVDERQITVDQAKIELNDIVDYEIFMDLSTANVEKLVTAIKTNNKFNTIVDNDAIKWDGNLTVTNDQYGNLVTNDDLKNGQKLCISGKIKHAFKILLNDNFKSTIILKQIKIS